jgi:hypothetical protein
LVWTQKLGNEQRAIEHLIGRAHKTAEHVGRDVRVGRDAAGG